MQLFMAHYRKHLPACGNQLFITEIKNKLLSVMYNKFNKALLRIFSDI